MPRSSWNKWLLKKLQTKRNARQRKRASINRVMSCELLGERITPAVTAFYADGVLSVMGDNNNNSIMISRNAAGNLLVNGGAVVISGGTSTIANTALIQVFAQGGDDSVTLNESNGALPSSNLFGGTGNDILTGGSGGDILFGQSGDDALFGKAGFDFLYGGTENDLLTGGDDDDQVFGETGNDQMIWNPGDDTDLNEGGDGSDTVQVNGGGGAEVFSLTANTPRVRFDRLDPAPFALDIGTTENLVLNANGGDDTFSSTGDIASLIQITVDGGAGNDILLGSNGIDLLLGGTGNDFIDGQQGNDVAFLGAGNDVFQWDPGDGSDTVEGQGDTDSMLFNGSFGSEIFEVSANGERVRFTRNLGTITMDLNDVEQIDLNASGGIDSVTQNDISGTDLKKLNVNLQLFGGGGDLQADTVTVRGRSGSDKLNIVGAGTSYSVVGLPVLVSVTGSEGAYDALIVETLAGGDTVTATTLPAGVVNLTIDGGIGGDKIFGSQGADVIIGGADNDIVYGDNGNDLAMLGAGNDVYQWDPGDGNDTLEGEAGTDRLIYNGASVAEHIDILANGGRVIFYRDVANVSLDMDDFEQIDFSARGGADSIVIGDLSGTDLNKVTLDLRAVPGVNGGDGAADQVIVSGTQANDLIKIAGSATNGVNISGIKAAVKILGSEAGNDRLTVNALGGDDSVNANALAANVMDLTINGGLGMDTMIGSQGNDLVNGGDGNDLALMRAGNDSFVWNPGDDNDVIEGQEGFDSMIFNGAAVSETVTMSANGNRFQFTRNIANVVMDTNDLESVNFNALGGADLVTINDLSGTDVTEVNVNLSGVIGFPVGDAQPDSIIVMGTAGADVILVTGDSSGVAVLGLAAQINITGAESANDRLTVNSLAEADVIEASGVMVGAIALTLDGGNDDDVLVGGDANDVLLGGSGDDALVGGPGLDVLDGGPGDNVVIQ